MISINFSLCLKQGFTLAYIHIILITGAPKPQRPKVDYGTSVEIDSICTNNIDNIIASVPFVLYSWWRFHYRLFSSVVAIAHFWIIFVNEQI